MKHWFVLLSVFLTGLVSAQSQECIMHYNNTGDVSCLLEAQGTSTRAATASTTRTYTQRAVHGYSGNRLTRSAYQGTDNPSAAYPIRHDSAGNVEEIRDRNGKNPRTLFYDERGRVVRVKLGTKDSNAPSEYHYYDENGQRIFRSEPMTDAAFVAASPTGVLTPSIPGTAYYYNADGKVIMQNGTGQANPHSQLAYYFWLGDIPVGYFNGSGVYNIYADHLNTPRSLYLWSEPWGNTLKPAWQWHYSAYGSNQPVTRRNRFKPEYWDSLKLSSIQEDRSSPDVVFDLRYPGQYYDHNTGLHQNWMRMYDPNTGRYTRADPIGLNGGMNRYAYVGGNALWAVDERGLSKLTVNYVGGGSRVIENPSASDFINVIKNAPNGSISLLQIMGHGDTSSICISGGTSCTDYIARDLCVRSNYNVVECLNEVLPTKINSNGEIRLEGCNNASGENSLAESISKLIPDTPVTGGSGYQLGYENHWILGNSKSSWGPKKTFINGDSVK